MQNEQVTVVHLKSEVLPNLFRDPATLGEYGAGNSNAVAMNEFSSLMESGAVGVLAGKIGEILAKLGDADPQRIAQKPTWFDRMLGRD